MAGLASSLPKRQLTLLAASVTPEMLTFTIVPPDDGPLVGATETAITVVAGGGGVLNVSLPERGERDSTAFGEEMMDRPSSGVRYKEMLSPAVAARSQSGTGHLTWEEDT